MSGNCQIPTPSGYVEKLLDEVGYTKHLFSRSFLENSCGGGNILKEAVRRYIKSAFDDGYSEMEIKSGLEQQFVGYDIDPECVKLCKHELDLVAEIYGITDVNWNVNVKDYLKCEASQFDFIVGNPPYITYHDLTDEQRGFLKDNFLSCKEGRFDYYYAFIEEGIKNLTLTGRLAYIIPYSILRNRFALNIRQMILPYLEKLLDYKGIEVFPSILTSSVAIICDANQPEKFEYIIVGSKLTKVINKNSFGNEWIFEQRNSGGRRFGDYFKVSNSVATLLNKAFIFDINQYDDNYYYVGNNKIEADIVYNAISAKSGMRSSRNPLKKMGIIFPYKNNRGKLEHFSEMEFTTKFPECAKYLKQFLDDLKKRNAGKGVEWFEYGRTQGIQHIFEDKLVLSLVITNKVNLYEADSRTVPYAGAYIRMQPNSEFTLKDAAEILQTERFISYVRSKGTPTTTISFRLSVRDIEDYLF